MNTAGTTTPRRQSGLDLGKTNPDCTARYHGTAPAYHYGCRCDHARNAHRLYCKRRRQGRAEPRRRIQALWAIGHTSATIGYAAGDMSSFNIQQLATRRNVNHVSRDAIRLAYNRLSAHAGTSVVTRKRAAAAGYAPPLAWDEETIDDPQAQPCIAPDLDQPVIDEVAIGRALTGQRVDLTPQERAAAVRAGLDRGLALTAIAAALHMSNHTAKALAA